MTETPKEQSQAWYELQAALAQKAEDEAWVATPVGQIAVEAFKEREGEK